MPAVVVRDLEKRFGGFMAVNRISFQVARGEIFGFLGPNGAGKSTTIRMLCGILAPTAAAAPWPASTSATQSEQIKAHIGYMSQKFSLYQDLTVEENIDFYSGIYRIPAAREAAAQAVGDRDGGPGRASPPPHGDPLRRLETAAGPGLRHPPPAADHLPRRAHLGRRSDQPPPVLGPDLRLAAQGVTVFVTTHYMDEAEYCDRLGLIYRGELIACGTPEALKREMMQEDVLEVVCDRPGSGHGGDRKAARRQGGGPVRQGAARGRC